MIKFFRQPKRKLHEPNINRSSKLSPAGLRIEDPKLTPTKSEIIEEETGMYDLFIDEIRINLFGTAIVTVF